MIVMVGYPPYPKLTLSLFPLARYGILRRTIRLPSYVLWDMLCFLVLPIRRFLNLHIQQELSIDDLQYLDLELPKVHTDLIEKAWHRGNRETSSLATPSVRTLERRKKRRERVLRRRLQSNILRY